MSKISIELTPKELKHIVDTYGRLAADPTVYAVYTAALAGRNKFDAEAVLLRETIISRDSTISDLQKKQAEDRAKLRELES